MRFIVPKPEIHGRLIVQHNISYDEKITILYNTVSYTLILHDNIILIP